MFKRIIISAAVVPLLALAGTSAASASVTAHPASSYGCRVVDAASGCGTQQEQNTSLVWAVPPSAAKSGTPVIVQPFSSSRSDQDFEMVNIDGLSYSTGGPDKRFEYAPDGDRSGLCISDPNNNSYTRLVLRPCNNRVFQDFAPVYNDGTVYAWESLQGNHNVIQDPSYGSSGTQLNVAPYVGDDNQLFVYNNSASAVTSF